MRSKLIIAFIFLFFTTSANAGWLSNLFSKKDADPVTQLTVETENGTDLLVEVSGSQFVELQKSEDDSTSRTECFKQMNTTGMDSHAQVIREVGALLGKGLDCGPNNADVAIAGENRKLGQTQARWGAFQEVTKTVIGGATKYAVVDKLGDAVIAGINKPGNVTTVTDGSTYQGAQGDGATYTEQQPVFSGIATNPADVNPINVDSEAGDITDAAECLAAGGDPIFGDNGEFERCSDGNGGTL